MVIKPIGDYVTLSQGLAINKGSAHLVSDTKKGKFILPLLRIADMMGNKYSKYISTDVTQNVIANTNDIIYTRTGQIGLVFRGCNGVVHNNSFIVTLNNNELDKDYLFVLLQSNFFRNQALSIAKNSVQPDLTHSMFKGILIPVPSKEEQKNIANVYLTLTSRINNNNKINAELESMAKTLYDYWFLQFEFPNEEGKPYKSSGGKMVWNDELKREIPEGWKSIKLKNIVKKINRVYDYNKESKTYDLSIMPSNSISINDTSSSKDFETNLFAVKEGDILFGSIRPYLRKAGIASYDGAVAGTIHCYEVIKESDYNLALFTLTSENMFKYAINNSKGTKMPVITSDDLLEFMLPYNEELAKKFNKIKIRDIIIANVKQSNELASLRDFLLPLLMNGQVTFKEQKL